MASRSAFTALTPGTPAFPLSAISPSSPNSRTTRGYARLNDDDRAPPTHDFIPAPTTARIWRPKHRSKLSSLSALDLEEIRGRGTSILDSVREFRHRNAGLLLIALAQAFFAFMNVSVKLLNDLDPPVPPLEVRLCIQCRETQTEPVVNSS